MSAVGKRVPPRPAHGRWDTVSAGGLARPERGTLFARWFFRKGRDIPRVTVAKKLIAWRLDLTAPSNRRLRRLNSPDPPISYDVGP